MTNERKEELVRKIVAYAAEQGNTLIDIPREVLQAVTDDIVENIGGVIQRTYAVLHNRTGKYGANTARKLSR